MAICGGDHGGGLQQTAARAAKDDAGEIAGAVEIDVVGNSFGIVGEFGIANEAACGSGMAMGSDWKLLR